MLSFLDKRRARSLLGYALLTALLTGWFCWVGSQRLIAKDEGFYLFAVREVLLGKNVYLDFFYPQMPVLPYLYAGLLGIENISWLNARFVSAIFCVLISLLLFSETKRKHSTLLALIFCTLFGICNFVYPWLSTVQTYGLSTLLLFASVILLEKLLEKKSVSKQLIILSAVLFALSVGTRLFFAGLFPLFLLYLFKQSKQEVKNNLLLFVGTGLLTGLLICAFFFTDIYSFYMNNLGYHFARSSKSFFDSLNNKYIVLKVVLGLKKSVKFSAPHITTLHWLFLGTCFLFLIRRRKWPFAFYIVFGLTLLNLLPNPTYVQYFSTSIPFLFLSLAHLFGEQRENKAIVIAFITLLAFQFLPHAYEDILRYTKTGKGVIGIRTQVNAEHWNVKNVSHIATLLNKHCSTPPCTAISNWPGYLVETQVKSVPGFENHFAPLLARKLNMEQRLKLHVADNDDILDITRTSPPTYVLLMRKTARKIEGHLFDSGYKKLYEWPLLRIYKQENES